MIVAEDITSRFLNVISLFNGSIPLVAIQMRTIRLGDSVSLVCSKVLDEMRLGLVDEDEEVRAADPLDQIETAVAHGVERRPARAASADMLKRRVQGVRPAVDARDADALDTAVETLAATSKAWHQAERVPPLHADPPDSRGSPARRDAVPEGKRGR